MANPWPRGLRAGSLGALRSPDERDPDAHRWLLAQIALARVNQLRPVGALQQAIRTEFTLRFAWSIPSDEALQAIASASPNGVLEVGAGNGYWAFLLRSRGIDVLAMDRFPVQDGENPVWTRQSDATVALLQRPWTHVQSGNGKDVGVYGEERTLLLCWFYSTQTVQTYRGRTIVFVGEWRGSERFAELYDALERGWRTRARIALPHFYGVADSLWILERRA